MSPLFACSACGVQIERSIETYRAQKGAVLCSTCKDRIEGDQTSSQPKDGGDQ